VIMAKMTDSHTVLSLFEGVICYFLSELPMNFVRTSNEKRPFLSELPMKNRVDTIVYHSIPQLRRVRLTLPRRAAFFQETVCLSDR